MTTVTENGEAVQRLTSGLKSSSIKRNSARVRSFLAAPSVTPLLDSGAESEADMKRERQGLCPLAT
jgi:hypothetical protein